MDSSIFDGFLDFLRNMQKSGNESFDKLGPLSPEDKAEWEGINRDHGILRNKARRLEAENQVIESRRKMFWAKIEEATGIYDLNMRIDDECNLLVERKTPKQSRDDDHVDED